MLPEIIKYRISLEKIHSIGLNEYRVFKKENQFAIEKETAYSSFPKEEIIKQLKTLLDSIIYETQDQI